MSVRESFEAITEPAEGADAFTRWPGLLSLSLGLLLGPIVALANQAMIYSANMWACGHGARGTMHIIPLLCLAVAIGAGITARRDWKAVGGGVHEGHSSRSTTAPASSASSTAARRSIRVFVRVADERSTATSR